MEDREAVSTSTWRLSELMFRLIIVIVFVAVVMLKGKKRRKMGCKVGVNVLVMRVRRHELDVLTCQPAAAFSKHSRNLLNCFHDDQIRPQASVFSFNSFNLHIHILVIFDIDSLESAS